MNISEQIRAINNKIGELNHLVMTVRRTGGGAIPDQNVKLDKLVGATYDNLHQHLNNTHSSARIDGGVISDSGGGQIDVALGDGIIKLTDSETGENVQLSWDTETNISLTDKSTNWVGIEYDAVTLQGKVKVDVDLLNFNFNTDFVLGRVYRDGNTVYILNAGSYYSNFQHKVCYRFFDVGCFTRATGAVISDAGNLDFAVSEGRFYCGATPFTTAVFDCSGADTFTYWYRDGIGGWTTAPGTGAIDPDHYDDSDGVLGATSPNKYAVHWVYICHDGSVHVQYGQGDYKLNEAEVALVPVTSDFMQYNCKLVGKIISQEGTATLIAVSSAFEEAFLGATASIHNELGGLQGGQADEYYHLIGAVRGDVVIGDDTPKWVSLPIGANGEVLTSDGTDVSWQAPAGGGNVNADAVIGDDYIVRGDGGVKKIQDSLLYLTDVGLLCLNDTINTFMDIGLTINQGTYGSEIVALKASDIDHGITGETETDTFLLIKQTNAGGGAYFWGFEQSGGDVGSPGASLRCYTKTSRTDHTIAGHATMMAYGAYCGGSATRTTAPAGLNIFGIRTYDSASSWKTLHLWAEDGEQFIWGINPKIFINEVTNAKMTIGITVQQGTASNEIQAGKASNVDHGITSRAETDTFYKLQQTQATYGGLNIEAYQDSGGAESPLNLGGYTKNSLTGMSATNVSAVTIQGIYCGGGTDRMPAPANFIIAGFRTYDSDGNWRYKWQVDQEGDTWQLGGAIFGDKVGIGCTPNQQLQVAGSMIWLDSNTNAYSVIDRSAVNRAGVLCFVTAGDSSESIPATGLQWCVGMPDSDTANVDGSEFFIGDTTSGSGAKFLIKTNGNVGFGTLDPGRLVHLSKALAEAWIEDTTSLARNVIDSTTPGIFLTARGMGLSNKYTPALKFGSTDPQFTTENPKFLAGIVGRCRETYGADTDSGMALDFLTSPLNAGTGNTTVVRMTLDEVGWLKIGAPTSPVDSLLHVEGGNFTLQGSAGSTRINFKDSDGNLDGSIYSDASTIGILDADSNFGVQVTTDTFVKLKVNNATGFVLGVDLHIDIYDWDDAVLREVSFGPDDSGGGGFKVLRVPN